MDKWAKHWDENQKCMDTLSACPVDWEVQAVTIKSSEMMMMMMMVMMMMVMMVVVVVVKKVKHSTVDQKLREEPDIN